MKFKLIFLILLFPIASYSQAIDSFTQEPFIFPFDSVCMSVWNIYFKENSLVQDESDFHEDEEIFRVSLSRKESDQLINRLRKKKSYDDVRALQNHYDLVFQFYQSGEIVCRVEISMMTGNITAKNLFKNATFRNGCSTSLGKHLECLLDSHGIIEQLNYDEIDLMGLRK